MLALVSSRIQPLIIRGYVAPDIIGIQFHFLLCHDNNNNVVSLNADKLWFCVFWFTGFDLIIGLKISQYYEKIIKNSFILFGRLHKSSQNHKKICKCIDNVIHSWNDEKEISLEAEIPYIKLLSSNENMIRYYNM